MQILLYLLLVPVVAIVWHEAAHAAIALAFTRAPVTLQVGFGPSVATQLGRLRLQLAPILLGGYCSTSAWLRRGDSALVAAAGPISSAFLAAVAWRLRHYGTFVGEVAVASAGMALLTAVPMRYPAVLAGGGDSDGLTVLRALFPASRMVVAAPTVERRPTHPLRVPFLVVLAVVLPVAFLANFWLGLFTLALFGSAYLGERR